MSIARDTGALAAFFDLPDQHNRGWRPGLTSICSAHPMVIRAAFEEAATRSGPVLIEATCNQVNQDGGYTGMTPEAFINFVLDIARSSKFDPARILFGGDHLGPNPWRGGPAGAAMQKAMVMVRDYARAGFGKIHLDASMACADDAAPLADATIAHRAARLAGAAEAGAKEAGHPPPGYVIGTEVPVPGGATHALDRVEVTRPEDAAATLELHREAFRNLGLADAFRRVVGVVVQPGVEFGHSDVIRFDATTARGLSDWRDADASVVFEAHSTDYQTAAALRALVAGGFAILKVGPGLTFALREALYALDRIAGELNTDYEAGALPKAMDAAMLAAPGDWQPYYSGTASEIETQRHFSYSDRIRYYWGQPQAQRAVAHLMAALGAREIPETLVRQHLTGRGDTAQNRVRGTAESLVLAHIKSAIAPYSFACADS